jgi:hypothetical protein
MLIISARSTFDKNAEYHGGWSPTWSAYETDGLPTTDPISDMIKVTRSQIGVHSFECGTDSCGGVDEPPMTLVTTIQHLLVSPNLFILQVMHFCHCRKHIVLQFVGSVLTLDFGGLAMC